MDDIITVDGLSRHFDVPVRKEGLWSAIRSVFDRKTRRVDAVDGISFSVQRGEILGFLGPNGAGKSTTLKMLTGILKPSSGTVRVLGYDPFVDRKEYTSHIGALFGQKSQLWWDIPPAESFRFAEPLYDLDRQEFEERKALLVDKLGVADVIGKPARNLSLGERMKCEFVMAMLHGPELVFLDEPTIGLDVFAKEAIRDFIKHANEEFGTTFILTTHDMDDIEHLAERVIVINNGRIAFDDSMSKLRKVAGDKKHVRLVTAAELPGLDWEGIEDLERLSEFEATFTLRRDVLSLDALVKRITKETPIDDLEVSDPDVERIIKVLYGR